MVFVVVVAVVANLISRLTLFKTLPRKIWVGDCYSVAAVLSRNNNNNNHGEHRIAKLSKADQSNNGSLTNSLKCYVKPMKDPMSVSPGKGNQRATRCKEKNIFLYLVWFSKFPQLD